MPHRSRSRSSPCQHKSPDLLPHLPAFLNRISVHASRQCPSCNSLHFRPSKFVLASLLVPSIVSFHLTALRFPPSTLSPQHRPLLALHHGRLRRRRLTRRHTLPPPPGDLPRRSRTLPRTLHPREPKQEHPTRRSHHGRLPHLRRHGQGAPDRHRRRKLT